MLWRAWDCASNQGGESTETLRVHPARREPFRETPCLRPFVDSSIQDTEGLLFRQTRYWILDIVHCNLSAQHLASSIWGSEPRKALLCDRRAPITGRRPGLLEEPNV